MALFLKRAGLEMTAVSYRGTAPALTDVIAGHMPAMFVPLPEAMPQAAAGAVRMLAISDDRRASQAKDVPTVAGIRLPGIPRRELERHDGAGRHAEAIIDRVAGEFVKAAKDPAFIAQLDKYGAAPARSDAGGIREIPGRGHRAVGRSGEGRRRDARQQVAGCR